MMTKQPTCSIGGCMNLQRARGWCTTHYWRWQKYGNPLALRGRHISPEHKAKLSAAGMGHIVSAKTRAKLSAATKHAMASAENRAKISAALALPLGSRLPGTRSYAAIKTADGWEQEHRVVMGVRRGDPRVVHHIDGNKRNNDPINLQIYETQAAHMRQHAKERRHAQATH